MSNEWSYEKLAERNYRILNEKGSEIVRDIYNEQIAKQMVRDHNAHDALVEAARFARSVLDQYATEQSEHMAVAKLDAAIALAQKESE